MLLAARVLTGAFGGILGGPGAGDHRRRFSGRTARPRDRDLDVGLRGASVVGVPDRHLHRCELGWHVPFLVLAALGLPVLLVGLRVLPPLRDHFIKRLMLTPGVSLSKPSAIRITCVPSL